MSVSRRQCMKAAAAIAATMTLPPLPLVAATTPLVPISRDERMMRLAKARTLMNKHGLGAILIEPGASLEYFTGVRWNRSERLTAAVIPAEGEPIIVTPFFEKPSIAESLVIPAEIRTWDEHEEPLNLVAQFLSERKLTGDPFGMEETNRFFIPDRLHAALPHLAIRNANPVVRGCRMIKSRPEINLMRHAAILTVSVIQDVRRQLKEGMTPGQIGAFLKDGMIKSGGSDPWALVLLGEASAYPHGSGKPQAVKRGEIVLIDAGCSYEGYQSDISRSFVFDADPTPEQRRVWEQVAQGQKIAFAAAKIGTPAGQVDDAVRAAYESWGYGPGYKLPGLSHRTGHGIGMEGHEPINLVHGETTPLVNGMCFSNEPGIYLPGKFGIRLEDCFWIDNEEPIWFTTPPPSMDYMYEAMDF